MTLDEPVDTAFGCIGALSPPIPYEYSADVLPATLSPKVTDSRAHTRNPCDTLQRVDVSDIQLDISHFEEYARATGVLENTPMPLPTRVTLIDPVARQFARLTRLSVPS